MNIQFEQTQQNGVCSWCFVDGCVTSGAQRVMYRQQSLMSLPAKGYALRPAAGCLWLKFLVMISEGGSMKIAVELIKENNYYCI